MAITGSGPTSRAALLTDLLDALAADHAFVGAPGDDTDLVIVSNPVDARWGSGRQRADYNAALKVVEGEGAVHFWESLHERGQGTTFGVFEADAFPLVSDDDTPASERVPVIGPGSTSWEWGYGTLLGLVEDVAHRHGYVVRVVLTRRSAAW